jgi:hypothetical protein
MGFLRLYASLKRFSLKQGKTEVRILYMAKNKGKLIFSSKN